MSIHDYKPETAEVKFKGGSLLVRGLALDDVAILMRTHLVDLDNLFLIYERGENSDAAVASFAKYAIQLAREAPGLVANVIALACDDGDNVDAYRKLPMPVMMVAIEKVAMLTFEEAGGPKKFVENLQRLLRAMRPSKTGSPT